MESTHPPLVRTRLSALMFFEFFIWGGWGFALGGYADNLGFVGWKHGLLIAIPALGAMISPLFVGLIADRFFPAQRMLSVLHLLGGACLLAAGFQDSFLGLTTLMMLNGLCFMPTIALANSVAFRHIPDPDKFPRIAVLGTIGWILAVIVASVFLGGTKTPYFLFLSGAASIVLAVYCLSLPDTPPKGAEAGADPLGLSALRLLGDPSFLVFIICVTLVSIPACGYFFALAGPMLQQRGYPAPLALTTLCQFAEIIFMFSMPWFVSRLGLKPVLLMGMLAWAVRYLCFMSPDFSLAIIGLLLHGLCYSFLYVGAYMYVNKRAPADLKASAQSLLAFLLLGVGWFVGAQAAGFLKGWYPADVPSMAAVDAETGKAKEDASLPRWDDPEAATSAWRYLDLSATAKSLFQSEKDREKDVESKPDLAQQLDADKDGKISLAEIDRFEGSGVTVDGLVYSKKDLKATFKKIHQKLNLDEKVALDRKEHWLPAQTNKWKPIWMWPSIAVFVVCAFFFLAFHDKEETHQQS